MSALLRVHEISERQYGLVHVAQARAAGLSPGQLDHSALTDRAADAARLAALRAAGFLVVEVTDEEVWHRPNEVVRRVGAARYELSGRRDVRRRDAA